MASSRVGGTKGKLRGQVGKTIYQVRKNENGTYTQIVYQKGERVETNTTPRLQAQRMATAMVESLMKQLKQIGRISFQSGKNKSQSLNAFSSWNLRKVANDMQINWYANQLFVFPKHNRTTIDIQDLGGPYYISSGSLTYDLFTRECYEPEADLFFANAGGAQYSFYGLLFDCVVNVETISSFMARHRMTVLDTMAFCGLRSYISYEPDPDDPTEIIKHEYFITKLNMRIDKSQRMTLDVIQDLFTFESSLQPTILVARDGLSFGIGWKLDLYHIDDQLYYMAGFSISYPNGRKAISSHSYHNPEGGNDPWLLDSAPTKVFGSWMGEPWNQHYPSPFI